MLSKTLYWDKHPVLFMLPRNQTHGLNLTLEVRSQISQDNRVIFLWLVLFYLIIFSFSLIILKNSLTFYKEKEHNDATNIQQLCGLTDEEAISDWKEVKYNVL